MKTIYYNGAVYTGDLPLCEAFIVCEDKFSFTGSSVDALAQYEDNDVKVDLNGKFVCPGFNDSHMHLLNYGKSLKNARLDMHTNSLADMISYLKSFVTAQKTDNTTWIIGSGWNQDYFCDVNRMPNRWDLDKVSEDIPVCAIRACTHALAVNSKALELLGITNEIIQPDGGKIGIENSILNGLFFDNATKIVFDAIPVPSKNEIKDMIINACKSLNSYGVTSCQSDDYCTFSSLPWQTVNEAYHELEESGQLTVRVYEQCNFNNLTSLKKFIELGNYTGVGSIWFKIGPLKMLGDGALGPRTAFLSSPYSDKPDTYGISVFSKETFDEMIWFAHSKGMQVAIHSIGDACLDLVLSSIEKALNDNPRKDHRHGIVHCQITRADQLEKIAYHKLHIYAQSIFLDYDIHIIKSRVGNELASTSYSWKTLMDKGASVSNGTDCPVELPFALGGIQCSITRSDLKGSTDPYLPNEGFTVKEALDSYTSGGAYSSFEETIKGKIAPEMLADFVILKTNPFDISPSEIKDIPVYATYVGGKEVFRNNTIK